MVDKDKLKTLLQNRIKTQQLIADTASEPIANIAELVKDTLLNLLADVESGAVDFHASDTTAGVMGDEDKEFILTILAECYDVIPSMRLGKAIEKLQECTLIASGE